MAEPTEATHADRVSFAEATRVWAKIGLLSFGGPAGQIALMHDELVVRRKWLDDGRFLHALNYCMLLPGPEAQQLATYIGWLMHRTKGGVVAGALFVLPGVVTMLALSVIYAGFREVPAVAALLFGLKSAVLAVVVEAVIRIGRRALVTRALVGAAASAFVAIFFLEVPFPWVIAGAAIVGLILRRIWPAALPAPKDASAVERRATVIDAMDARGELAHTQPSHARALRVLFVCVALWVLPFVLFGPTFGWQSVWVDEARFFSQSAVVTFGGAYAVLAYVAQQAVDVYAWLRPGEMLDALGLAETTPGPLILVVQFVGFLGAYRHPMGLHPMVAGVLGSLVTVWVTFVPCFLFILLGAPYVESLRGNRSIHAALSTITAAVVGVILNLSVWFALHVAFTRIEEHHVGPIRLLVPEVASIDVAATVLAAAAMIAMLRLRQSMARTLAASAVLGAIWKLATT